MESTQPSKVRWAVIGAGGIARRRTIPEGIMPARNAELVAVYSPHTGEEVARQFGVAAASSEQELFESECDAVYVASPVDCHVRQVIQSAAVGKHVLCEKPLALNVLEANEMVAACQRAGVLLGVAFMMRTHPLHRQIRDLVRDGRIGQPTCARAQLACWYPPMAGAWRQNALQSGGGALPDLASHCLDLLEMILGQKITSVAAVVKTTFHNYSVDDTAVLAVEFDGGTVATVDCLFNVPDQAASNRLEVYGSRGSILADGTLGQTATGAMKWFEESGGWSSASYDAESMYLTQIEEFGSAVVENRLLDASGEQGLWIQHILAACQESAASGRRVSIAHDFRTAAGVLITPLLPGRTRLRTDRDFCSRASGGDARDFKRFRRT